MFISVSLLKLIPDLWPPQSSTGKVLPANNGTELSGIGTPGVSSLYVKNIPQNLSNKIAFIRSDSQYYFMEPDGSKEYLIAQLSGNLLCPRISPDLTKIVFNTEVIHPPDIYTMSIDGKNIRNLTNTIGQMESCAAWARNGSELLYEILDSHYNDIGIMSNQGTDQRFLTNMRLEFPNLLIYRPELFNRITHSPWSPDGSRFVFYSNRGETSDIYVMNLDGSGLINITDNRVNNYNPVWSPDGGKIAYASYSVGDNLDIFVIDVENSKFGKPINITSSASYENYPAWSPTSDKLVFISDRDGNRDIFVMNSDGSNVKKLTNTLENEAEPYWLP